jgi:Glycosyltransferase family 87
MFNKRRFFINLALGLIFAVSLAFYYITIITLADPQKIGDFYKFYMSAKLYWEGKGIYSPVPKINFKNFQEKESDWSKNEQSQPIQSNSDTEHPNLNPPFQTLILAPVGLIKYEQAFLIYSFISITSGLVAVILIAQEMANEKYELSFLFTFMIIIMLYFPTWSNILYGQLSLILLLLITLVWTAARNGRDALGGIYLGLAMSFKIFVGLFLLFFLVRRRWRLLFWFITTFTLLSLLPLWFFGIDTYKNYITTLSSITWFAASWNASFLGFFTRIFGGSENVPLYNLPQLAHALASICSLTFALWLVWLAWPRPQESSPDFFDLSFSLTITGMLLISPLGWMYYFPLLIIPAAAAWRMVRRLDARTRIWYQALIILAWLLSTVPHFLIPSAEMGAPLIWFTWAGFYFYSLLLFSFILGTLAHRLKKGPLPANPS